jgi:hypothetical protein
MKGRWMAMALSWTDEVTGPSEGPEAAALLGVLDRYHQRVVEQLAVTEELLGQAGQLDRGAEGVAETLALLEVVAGHLRLKDGEIGLLKGSLQGLRGSRVPGDSRPPDAPGGGWPGTPGSVGPAGTPASAPAPAVR